MYNRYVRNDHGTYTRIPQPEQPFPGDNAPQSSIHPEPQSPPSPPPSPSTPISPPPKDNQPDSDRNILNRLLHSLHLGDLDSGDLILLLILFLLFREKADEELLIAIGLLLIL